MSLWFNRGDQLFEVTAGTPEHEQLVKLGAQAVEGRGSGDDLSALKVHDLRALADERGLEVPRGAKKADLIELLTNPPAGVPDDDGEPAGDPDNEDGGESA